MACNDAADITKKKIPTSKIAGKYAERKQQE